MKKALFLLFFWVVSFAFAQKEVTGTIQDNQGMPIIGVNVIIKGTQTGVSTDFEGTFGLRVKVGDVLVFSALGFKTQERKVGKESVFNIVMEEDLLQVGEVVVTGYQTIDPTKVATSYTNIDIKNFERKGATDVISGLEGLSASLVMTTNPNNPTGSKEFSIRGVSTLSGDTKPLIVLDGFQYEGRLEDINPYEVENITLLKDAASASIYGAKSSNGVIVITTRKGKAGKTQVRYTSNLTFQDKMDLNYTLNRVSSSKLVDIQLDIAKLYDQYGYLNNYRYAIETNSPYASSYAAASNRVYYLYGMKKYGYITPQEYDQQMAQLRWSDNTQDIEKLYLQNPITNQQNISVSGGSEVFKYRSSLNYTQGLGNIKGNETNRFIFDFVSNLRFSSKVNLDFQTSLTSNNNHQNLIEHGVSNILGSDIARISSYDRFFDANANPLSVFKPQGNRGIHYGGKDPYEIKRLVDAGLLDETYYPAKDFGKYSATDNNWTAHVQGLLNIDIAQGLTAKVGGQLRREAFKQNDLTAADSWYMASLINNTTPLSYDGDRSKLPIPYGARFSQILGESIDYVLRSQLEYRRNIDKHNVHIFAGAEMQENFIESTSVDRFGYDPKSGIAIAVDNKFLSAPGTKLERVYHPEGYVYAPVSFSERFQERQNRYIAGYSNFTYLYDNRYILSGSIRMDQSNLFGTDPRYRYKPFWSLAGRWRLGEEAFLKDKNLKIDARVSFGVNGNIANQYGPFDIANKYSEARSGNVLALSITTPRVNNLRWERSETTNFGLDLSFFDNRLDLVLDYYRKNTTDVLTDIESDPTFGSGFIPKNDASLINNGYEIMLTSKNIRTQNTLWETQLFFRYNHSKVTQASFNSEQEKAYRRAGDILNIKGNEPRSLYVFEYAGVSPTGGGQIRKADGSLVDVEMVRSPSSFFSYDDLKTAGTIIPKYVASMNNNFSYKGIGLSCLFVYQGGHVMMKDSYNGATMQHHIIRINKDAEKAWEKPGDEQFTDIPRIGSATYHTIIRGSTKNVLPADFIRLRDVVASYTLPTSLLSPRIKELTFNLRASNLWLWTKNNEGIDPETQGLGFRGAKLPKSYTMGINVIF